MNSVKSIKNNYIMNFIYVSKGRRQKLSYALKEKNKFCASGDTIN